MPGPPTDPQPTANDRVSRKRQARLDDNGEPIGLPAPKKKKSVENDGRKKEVPAKTRPEKNNNPAPLKKTPSVEIPVTASELDVTGNATTKPSKTVVVVSSDDDEEVLEVPEAPEEDAEVQLGAHSAVFI